MILYAEIVRPGNQEASRQIQTAITREVQNLHAIFCSLAVGTEKVSGSICWLV